MTVCVYLQGGNDGDFTKTSEFPVDNDVSCLLALYFYIFMTCLTDNHTGNRTIRQQLNSFDSLRRLVLCGHVIHVVDFSNCTAVANCLYDFSNCTAVENCTLCRTTHKFYWVCENSEIIWMSLLQFIGYLCLLIWNLVCSQLADERIMRLRKGTTNT